MFTGYNLKINESSKEFFLRYREDGEEYLKHQKAEFKKKIEDYILNGIADGTQIERDWFPTIEADIFISHSHNDEELAKGIAGWLYKNFELKCFIDSCVWGYADDLLEKINEGFSDKRKDIDGGYLYNHKKCNTASKHVNTMLSVALQKMIDKTEVTILLNTNSSISKYEDVYQDATYSPWIYSEIICTQIVRKKPLIEYRKMPILKHVYESAQMNEEYSAAYEVSLDHLNILNEKMLCQWKERYKKRKITYLLDYPLDYLYEISNQKKMEKWKNFNERYDILYEI